MAWSLVRSNIKKPCKLFLKEIIGRPVGSGSALRAVLGSGNVFNNQVAFISSKRVREELQLKRPPPFPYDRKKYTFLRQIFDNTMARFDDNTKIVIVDGNIAAGKSSFAQKLAEEMDMYYVREPDMEIRYINSYGYDLRNLDPQLPEGAKSCDLKRFYREPNNINVTSFQFNMLVLRVEFYVDALCHLLNTGQGIVMDRSVYSDIVFLESMVKFGYISKNARKLYYKLREAVLLELMKPHLVVYLDVPAKTCYDRIKRRATPHEIETKVLTLEYLESIENVYKHQYLPEMSEHSEILVFDWSEYGDVEVVVEDIERIDFDSYEKHDPKCKDWRIYDTWDWDDLRSKYTTEKEQILTIFNYLDLNVPEMIISAQDNLEYNKAMEKAPGQQFQSGFNPDMGDKWVIFKDKTKPRNTLI